MPNQAAFRGASRLLGCAHPISRTIIPALTSCPSCLQGLGRLGGDGARPEHLAVHLARRLDGPDWRERFAAAARGAQVIHS